MESSEALDTLEESVKVLGKEFALRGVMGMILATVITNNVSDKLAREIADEIYEILNTKEEIA